MTIQVKKSDVEMLSAFLNQCEGEVIATIIARRRRNAKTTSTEALRCDPLQPVQVDSPDNTEIAPEVSFASNGKFLSFRTSLPLLDPLRLDIS